MDYERVYPYLWKYIALWLFIIILATGPAMLSYNSSLYFFLVKVAPYVFGCMRTENNMSICVKERNPH